MSVALDGIRELAVTHDAERAAVVRNRLTDAEVVSLSLTSSSGAGKTTLLERTLDVLKGEMELVIVSGDVRARQDEAWLGRHRPRVVHPVLTEPAWLDAHHIERALDLVDVDGTELLLIERSGDFVFGASTDLGEDARVVLLPVTDGDDKPLKYPTPYREARHLVITKMDLLAFVPFNLRRAVGYARDANPDIDILYTSALTGEGMDEWYDLLRAVVRRRAKRLVEFA